MIRGLAILMCISLLWAPVAHVGPVESCLSESPVQFGRHGKKCSNRPAHSSERTSCRCRCSAHHSSSHHGNVRHERAQCRCLSGGRPALLGPSQSVFSPLTGVRLSMADASGKTNGYSILIGSDTNGCSEDYRPMEVLLRTCAFLS